MRWNPFDYGHAFARHGHPFFAAPFFFGHHGFGHHGHRPSRGWFGGRRDAAERQAARLDRMAAWLDLDAAQRERLDALLTALRRVRAELRTGLGDELPRIFESENLDRERAQRVLEAQLDRTRADVPALVGAAADFFESLDFEQQQAVRFGLRAARRASRR